MVETIENVLCFLILASIVIQLAPNDSYKKCLKFFIGIIFVIMIISSITGVEAKFEHLDIIGNIPKVSENEAKYYESIFNDYYGNVSHEED